MNYYETLGVAQSAEPQVIEAAYRAMMRRYHPDTFQGPREEAERRSKQLNEAYATLRNPERRRAYDETLGPRPRAAEPPETYEERPSIARAESLRHDRAIAGIFLTLFAGMIFAIFWLKGGQAEATNSSDRQEIPAKESPQPSPIASPSPTATESQTAGDCRGLKCRILSPFGWAGMEAGVSMDSARHASGIKLKDDLSSDGSCRTYTVIGGPGNVWVMAEDNTISTIEVQYDPSQPSFRTDRGVKLGDPESAVRAAYGRMKQLPDIYSEPPDKKLFYYEPGGERGIKFSINGGKVSGISVGTKSIEYVEGCL